MRTFDGAVQCGFDVTFPCLARQFVHQFDLVAVGIVEMNAVA